MSSAGERVELARYDLPSGGRIVYGQRIDGAVTVMDVPGDEQGRVYLVERQLESKAALDALVADYVAVSTRHGVPGATWIAVDVPHGLVEA